MPKVMTNRLPTSKLYKHIDLEPSKAWIRNLGVGTTRVMPKHKWTNQKTLEIAAKTKFKSVKMIKRPVHSLNSPILKHVLHDYFDGPLTRPPHKCGNNTANPVDANVQLPTPAHKLSIDSATLDFSPPSTTNSDNSQSNDTPSPLPLSSSELPLDVCAKTDKESHDMCDILLVKGKRLKIKCFCLEFAKLLSFHIFILITVEVKSSCDLNTLDAHIPCEISPYTESNIGENIHGSNKLSDISWSLLTQAANNQMPKASSLSTDAFIHPVYMCQEDVNHLVQSGHIFLIDERLHYYEHKNVTQTDIF